MNNDLEQFSEGELYEISQLTGGYPEWVPSYDQIKALARIALAAKQAKPVCYADQSDIERITSGSTTRIGSYQTNVMSIALYTTPQPAHTEQVNSPELPDGWVKCDDLLPEDDTLCVAIDSEGVIWTMLFEDDDFYPDTGEVCQNEITHWMPLPQPPVAAPKPESE